MTGAEVIAVVIGTVAGVGLGAYTVRHRPVVQTVGFSPGEHQHQIDALMSQQRRWVIAALDRMADHGVIEDTQRRQGHFFHDIAEGVDRCSERLAAHRELMTLWASMASTDPKHIDGPLPEHTRVSQELSSLQAQIDQLDRAP